MIMKFEAGENYLIDYGVIKKVATFLHSENGNNLFFDISGKFVFSDAFIAKGSIKIEKLDDED